ncbi:hypothetical protein EVG20_g9438 [Dentipellis fragilis]|uniref:Uncharacterized protein n=1 Tax=Dentipellis fragilis TaxID=205917 RepID=A0A4Y9XYD2_9AGAM|nr:hypothetical protein EVG20_g9438 [Dentipellis fragilis]
MQRTPHRRREVAAHVPKRPSTLTCRMQSKVLSSSAVLARVTVSPAAFDVCTPGPRTRIVRQYGTGTGTGTGTDRREVAVSDCDSVTVAVLPESDVVMSTSCGGARWRASETAVETATATATATAIEKGLLMSEDQVSGLGEREIYNGDGVWETSRCGRCVSVRVWMWMWMWMWVP